MWIKVKRSHLSMWTSLWNLFLILCTLRITKQETTPICHQLGILVGNILPKKGIMLMGQINIMPKNLLL
uniref:Putative secreted protein n=1 Tax=Xenopsylla cheopis TaxID=163159 RepID=A0A6M2E2F0_XENCH